MVKIPGLDDLKKMGTDLMDSAKSVKFAEVVDKFKSKGPVLQGDEALKAAFQELTNALGEISQAQTAQIQATKKLENQLSVLAKILEHYQPVVTPPASEDTKSDETK